MQTFLQLSQRVRGEQICFRMKLTGFQLLCRCLVLSIIISASGLPLPASIPEEIVTVVGKDVRLPCDVGDAVACSLAVTVEWLRTDGASPLQVHTLHLGKELRKEQGEEYHGRTAATSNCSLTLLGLQVQDTGTYKCVLVRSGGEKHEASVSLVVAEVFDVKPVIGVVLGVVFGVSVGIAVMVFVVRYWKRGSDVRDQSRMEPLLSDYRNIRNLDTVGASEDTARAYGLESGGIEASREMAKRDEKEMGNYKEQINSVGQKLKVHPALIAGIISRQSWAGKKLMSDGYGNSDSNCFGLMQIHKEYHAVRGGPYSEEHVEQGVDILVQAIKTMERAKTDWTKEQRLKGALACYMLGDGKVLSLDYEEIDGETDFASDVIARAQWFADNGY